MSIATLPTSLVRPKATTRRPRSAPNERLVFIDSLRGLAATAVATYHIHRYGPLHEAADSLIPEPLAVIFEHGWMGVQVFFVISGFVIAYSVRAALITPRYLANFALRRSIRLDPPYWTTIAVVLLLFSLGGPLNQVDPLTDAPATGQLLAHPFYLQDILGHGNVSVGFWSLCIEVQFYLLLVVALGIAQWCGRKWGQRSGNAETASFLLLTGPLALFSLAQYDPGGRFDVWIVHFFCMFFLGVLAFMTYQRRLAPAWFWGYVALMLLRLGISWSLEIACATVAGVTIYAAGKTGGLNRWLAHPVLQYFGRISYSLYLIHYPVSWLVVGIGYQLTGTAALPALVWHALALGLSIAAAHVLHCCVEAPSMALARRLKPVETADLPMFEIRSATA
jgi:peptidoglycan/LPS O-acetylase OafA/YrhL